jgi:hypothetical protein
MATTCKERALPEKVCSREEFLKDVESLGAQITAIFRRHECIDGADMTDLLHAKDRINRIRGRLMRRT